MYVRILDGSANRVNESAAVSYGATATEPDATRLSSSR